MNRSRPCNTGEPSWFSAIALSLLAILAFGSTAAARNVIEGFTKSPTFTPPQGCIPREQTYGVLSRCEKQTDSGGEFVVQIDTAVGWFYIEPSERNEIFARDHVAEIREWWQVVYPQNKLRFSSRASDFAPANAPEHGTACFEYSIAVEIERKMDDRSAPATWLIEGLTCAWSVLDPEAGKPNVEIFWLEVSDLYVPSLGQEPMEDFDEIVRRVFASARL